jgi:2-dehydropantoate 2-reductase
VPYRSVNPATGEVLKTFTEHTDPPDATSSMQRDLIAGRPSELEAQSGSVVRLGRACNFPTSVHEVIYNALLPGELRARGKLRF